MISKDEDYVRWVLLVDQLCEARDHLNDLIKKIDKPDYDEDHLIVDLGHIYAHLNRFANSRSSYTDISEDNWDEMSKFPEDIKPVG